MVFTLVVVFHAIPTGVPQGSHLDPLLFILCITDIPDFLCASNNLMFADDLKIFRKVQSYCDAFFLQRGLDMLSLWCQRKRLFLNIIKGKVMSLHRKKSSVRSKYR